MKQVLALSTVKGSFVGFISHFFEYCEALKNNSSKPYKKLIFVALNKMDIQAPSTLKLTDEEHT